MRRTAEIPENCTSPVIVPRNIKRVSCKFVPQTSSSEEEEEPQFKRAPSVHAEEYASSALTFLLGIQSEGLSSQKPHEQSPQFCEKSYQDCLSKERPQSIDLRDWPTEIKNGPLKDGVNSEFFEGHSWISKNLTLSKLVNLKAEVFALRKHLDPFIVAAAWVYFLGLANSGVVNKRNRKVLAAASVLVAYKYYEEVGEDFNTRIHSILKILKTLDRKENLSTKDILKSEFFVYSALNFSLFIEIDELHDTIEDVLDLELPHHTEEGKGTLFNFPIGL